MKLYRLYSLSLFMAMCHFLSAQSIGIGTSTPNPKAILDVESTNQGILLPRLTDTSAVSAPVPAGLTIYSISDKKIYFYDGTKWKMALRSIYPDLRKMSFMNY